MFYLRASRNSRLLRSFLILVICAGVLALLQVTKARVNGPRSPLTRGSSPLSLGDYPDTSLQLSANTTVMPDAAPSATTSISVSTSTSFKGQLIGNPSTGVVRVTDAHPAGTYTVKVTAFDGVPTTKTFTLTVTTPATCNPVTFAGATNFDVGIHPRSTAIGDFNGDGRQDLATANVNSGNVSVLLGDGAGSFGAAPNIVVGGLPAFLAVGDFNGDGNQDLATANATSADVSILLGNGAGGFSVFDTFGAGSNPESVAVGDFNNDGKQDLAVANSGSDDVSVLLGDGAGSFSAANSFGAGSDAESVAVGDFDNDGKQDLAVTNSDSNDVSVLLGDGTGNFDAAPNLAVGMTPHTVTVGDFDRDGKQDLAIANGSSGNVSILLGNGAGGFSVANNFDVGTNPFSVAVGDFNSDGKQDLAVANVDSNNVSILLGDGAGSFSAATNFSVGTRPFSVVAGDFNADGKQDVAAANLDSNNVSVLLRQCPPPFLVTNTADSGPGSFRQAIIEANDNFGPNTINFNIPGAGVKTITPTSPLPPITGPVVIDGYTQPGASVNTLATGDNAVLLIELNGIATPSIGLNISAGQSTVRGLVINRFVDGIRLQVSGGNIIEGNFLGTNANGTADLGNSQQGVTITSDNNRIGGSAPAQRNIISGNGRGVSVGGPSPGSVVIQGNYIGTDKTGTAALGNDTSGVFISGERATIGGTTAGEGNLISGNSQDGLSFSGINASGNVVEGNLIGTNVSGTAALPNGQNGISLSSVRGNIIGGTTAAARNIISGNGNNGIALSGLAATDNKILGNFIGTNAAGTAAISNGASGVLLFNNANANRVGGTTAGETNVISGNHTNGITIENSIGTMVQGNLIGTNVAGTAAISNDSFGVLLTDNANSNTIGGTTAAARNIISGNSAIGVGLFGGSTSNFVQGNFIGTDISGTSGLGNVVGVSVQNANNNFIGGTTAGERNVISGNSGVGISIGSSSGTLVQGNFIGTQANGTSALGNSGGGVAVGLTGNNNTIGGVAAGAGNTIANNGRVGVVVTGGPGNLISGNSIFANGTPLDLGIDLGFDGVTTNDPGDADIGPNNLQNFPDLMAVVNTGSDTVVQGRLNSMPSTSFDIQFFSNQACDPSDHGEGQTFIGSTTVTTNESGDATFNTTLAVPVAVGQFVTATATDPGNNTSEFSACQIVTPPSLSINDVSLTEGNSGTTSFMFTVSLSNPSSAAITVNYATANGTATTVDNDYSSTSGTMIFAPGETNKPVMVLVKGDTKFEPDETFFVNLSSPVSATISDSQGQGTILNDDGQPTITINDVSKGEANSGSSFFMFTVSLSNESYQTITVDYATANGTATAGSDYDAISSRLIFDPGVTSLPVLVQVKGDTLNEAHETFSVNLSGPSNAAIADGLGVGTITNDDPPGALTISDVSQTEGNSGTASFVFNVSLSAASGQTVTVNYATADVTATAGIDYQALSSTTLTFNPGVTMLTISVPVIGDLFDEPDETFFVHLSAPTNATIVDNQGVGTIRNDDPPGTLKISGRITDADNNSLPDVTVTLSGPGPITVVKQSALNGTYSFPGLTKSGSYTVSVQSAVYVFSPSRLEFRDLGKDEIANFIAAPVSVGPPLALSDDFTCKYPLTTCAPDPDKWIVGAQPQSQAVPFDSRVTVAQVDGELVITPLHPRESGPIYNGIVSKTQINITTDGKAVAEVPQVAPDGADTIFAIGNDPSNFFRFKVHTEDASNSLATVNDADCKDDPLSGKLSCLVLQAATAGQLSGTSIRYDRDKHRFLRFVYIPPSTSQPRGAIAFEASRDGVNYREPPDFKPLFEQPIGDKPLDPMKVELIAGTNHRENSMTSELSALTTGQTNPLSAKFGSVQVNSLPFSGGNLKTVLAADQVTMRTWTLLGRTYAFVKLTFPNAGYRVADEGQVVRAGNDFSADAVVERSTGGSIQAVKTTAQIYDLGQLTQDSYTFTFKNSGVVVKSHAFTVGSALPANPIDDARKFVRKQYLDFLNREPDDAGWDHWTGEITQCTDPLKRLPKESEAECVIRKRADTSAAFFLSPEFQNTGYFVLRVYRGSLGRMPYFGGSDPADNLKDEFTRDHATVSAGIVANDQLNAARIDANKLAFTNAFVNRAEFRAIYDSLNNQQYVDKLIETTGIQPNTPPLQQERQQLIAGLSSPIPTETRASVLFKIVDGTRTEANGALVFETAFGRAFYEQQFNAAFVQMEYFGYLHRDPDDAGYAFWLSKLNQFTKPNEFKGDFVNAQMVLAFISSPEYRSRFGQP